MRKILFILVLVLGIGGVSIAQTAQTQPSKEYVTALKKMIVVSGSDATFKLVIPQMFAMMKQQLPNVPAEFWSEAEKEMMKDVYKRQGITDELSFFLFRVDYHV